jgi:hypothetical protein
MTDLTTAQRLAAYADELKTAGLDGDLIQELVRNAGLAIHARDGEPTVQADIDETSPAIGRVTIELRPHIDEDAIDKTMAAIHDRAVRAQNVTRH